MRRLKFRQPIFNPNGTFLKWHYWGHIRTKLGRFTPPESCLNESQNIHFEALGLVARLTGDINPSHEVYEGDIIKSFWTIDNAFDTEIIIIGVLVRQDANYYAIEEIALPQTFVPMHSFITSCLGEQNHVKRWNFLPEKTEILGNIIQNPHLIEALRK